MTDRINIHPRPILPGGNGLPQGRSQTSTGGRGFDALLQQKIDQPQQVRLSRHASERLQQRGLALDQSQTQRLDQAVARVASKGSRDSLVMLDDLAMVVSVKNQTVITVADRSQLQDNVFTKIDSAVFA